MKKLIVVALVLVMGINNYAQEIKVKKGQVLLNDTPIGKMERTKMGEYKISNLDDSNSITAYVRTGKYPFIAIKSETLNKINELDFIKFSAFNLDRSIIETLFAKQMITDKGIVIEKINAFLNEEPSGLGKKYGYVSPEEIAAKAKAIENLKLTIADNGAILQKTNKGIDTIIGRIKQVVAQTGLVERYEVQDLDNYRIATWYYKQNTYTGNNELSNQVLITFDKKVFPVEFNNFGNFVNYKMSQDITAKNIVATLLLNGYGLKYQGKQVNDAAMKEYFIKKEEAINSERASSNNIYEQDGYVINAKGEKLKGPITVEFESIKAASEMGATDMTAYGKTVILKYSEENNRKKTEVFKSKNGIKFCINKGDKEECYLGLKTIGNTMAAAGSLNSLSFDFSSFYKILYEKDGYLVLVDPIVASDFIIKIPSQEKGLYTNKSNIEKLKKNFSEYVNCPSFVFENYDFKTLEGLIKVLEGIQSTCK